MKKFSVISLNVVVFMITTHYATAEVVQRSESASTARVQMMLRQVAADRDSLKAQNGKQKSEIEKLKKQVDKLKDDKSRLTRKLEYKEKTIARYSEVNTKLRDRIDHDRDRTLELIDKFKKTIVTLKQLEIAKNDVDSQLASAKQNVKICSGDNKNLYATNIQLLKLYKDKSVWDALMQKEPVTQLKRVAIENIGEKYKGKMQDFRFANNASE